MRNYLFDIISTRHYFITLINFIKKLRWDFKAVANTVLAIFYCGSNQANPSTPKNTNVQYFLYKQIFGGKI